MCAKEFFDAVKHHMLHLLQRKKTHLLLYFIQCMNEFGPSSAFNAERYVCLRLVYVTIILSTIVDLSLLNSKLRALWKTDYFQAMT